MGSSSPSGEESTESDSEPSALDILAESESGQLLLDEYGLTAPTAPEDPMEFDSWFEQNGERFSFQQPQSIDDWYEANQDRFDPVVSTGNEMQDRVNLDAANNRINEAYKTEVFDPATQAYEQSITNAYDQEVYQPYAESFDAYQAAYENYKSGFQDNATRLLREIDPVAFKAGVDSGEFSITQQSVTGQFLPGSAFNIMRPEGRAPLLIGDQISTRALYSASDLLGGLSLEDGSIDEYLNTEISPEFLEETRASVRAQLDAVKLRKENYLKSMRSVPQGDALLSDIDKEIATLESQLDQSGDLTDQYVRELKANALKKFMNANLSAQVNRIAELKGIEKGTEEFKKLAKDIEAEVFGTSVVGSDFYDIQQSFKGTAVSPNMFKFMLDENNVIGDEAEFWDEAAISWDIGTLELEKQLDAMDTAIGVEYTEVPIGTPYGLARSAMSEEDQEKRQEAHLKYREKLEAEQYKLQLQMSQYAVDAKTWKLFGKDAISLETDLLANGLKIKEDIGRQIASDIERTYALEAIQSMPVSLTMMAPGLALAPFTGGMSTAAAFAVTATPTFAFTTAMVGSDRYYGTMLMEGDVWQNMSSEDRFWHSLRYGMSEGFGEAVSAGTVGVAGRFLRGTRFSPFAATGYKAGTGADVFYRIGRGATGIALATGVGVVEESAAEFVTGFSQGFDTALMEGKSLSEAFLVGKELGTHGANVGKYMGFLPGGSVVVEQTKAAYLRKFNNEEYNDIVSMTAFQQEMNDALPARTRRKLDTLRGQLSENHLITPTKSDRAVLAKIETELEKIDANNEATRKALEHLGKSNPALVADMLIANNYHQFLENVRIGGGKLDKNGRLRDWNGRFVAASNNPMYDFAQGMSQERFAELQEAYNKGGKQIQNINLGLLMFSGEGRIGIDSFGGLVTTQGQDWRSRGFTDAREVVIDGDQEVDTSQFTASEIKVLQNVIDQAKKSGRRVSIVLHDDESLAYINGEGVRSEARVPFRNELLVEGLYMERPDGSHEIHIHKDADLSRVAFHEYTHFFLEPLFQDNPEMVYDLAEQIRGLKSERVQELVEALDMQYSEASRGERDRELITALFEAIAEGEFIRSENPIEGFEISDLGVKAVVRNVFSKIAGFPDASTDSDLINLVLRFKNFAEGESLGEMYTTVEQVETAEDIAEIESGQPLASKKQYLQNVEIFWTQNPFNFGDMEANARVGRGSQMDSQRSKTFNDYRHFANWYASMTGNGRREGIIRDIHFFRDGKRFNLNYPKPRLDKDGKPKVMKPMLQLPREGRMNALMARVDVGKEVAMKKGSLTQETSRIHNMFRGIESKEGKTFTLDFHSFKPVVDADTQFLTPVEDARFKIQQRNNMLALMNSGIDLVEVHAKVQAKSDGTVYVLDRKNAPELFDLAKDYDFLTADEANAQLEYEATELGVNVWELLPPGSISRKRKVEDLSMIPEDELSYATIRLEEIKEGADFVLDAQAGGPLRSTRLTTGEIRFGSKKKGRPTTYGDMGSSDYINMSIGMTEEDALSLSDRAVFGENRRQALEAAAKKLGITVKSLMNNMVSKAILYDRTRHGKVAWVIRDKNGNQLKDSEGNGIALIQNQIGGPLGAVAFNDAMLSSHVNGESASAITDMPVFAKYVAIDIALRAPENTLRSPKTIEMFFRYVNQYYSQNKAAGNNYNKDLIATINEVLKSQIGVASKEYQTTRGTNSSVKRYSKFERVLNDRKLKNKSGIKIKKNRITIQDEQGLEAFLDFMSNLPEHVNEQLGFEGRGLFIDKIVKGMKARKHAGFLSKEEILETMNDPRFNDLGADGTGRIVATYVARTSGLTTEKLDDTTGDNFNNGFPIAVMAESMNDVVYALYDKASDADVIYNPDKPRIMRRFGQHAQQESKFARGSQALKSRRLMGRVYTQGNSTWERSTATPYGEKLATITRRLQDKYSDVMLLQQDIEVFKGQRVPESQDFEMAIDLFYGKVREDMEALGREIEKIGKSLEVSGHTVEDLSDLLYALHAKERNAHIAKKRKDLDAGSGMTNEEADAIIDELMSPEIMDSVNLVYDIVANTRKTMIEGGLESREVIAHWESLFKNYVPLNGLALDEQSEESNSYPTGGGGFSVYGRSSKKAKGRKSRTGTNIVASVIAQNMAIKQRARKDESMRSLHRLVQENPNENVWKLYSEANPMTKLADDGSQQKMNVAEMKAHRHMVPLRINGKQHFIFFKDMSYADALNGLTEEETGSAVKNMGKYISLLRNFATVYNPAFFIKNYVRDIGSAVFNAMSEVERDGGIMTGFGLKPGEFSRDVVSTSLKVLKPLLKEGVFGFDLDPEMAKQLQEWKQSGGRTGWAYSETIAEIQGKLEKAAGDPAKAKEILKGFYQGKKIFEYIEGINEAFENAIRFAAYLEARKVGVSKQRAAQLSKNITVNFNRSGEASSSYNSMYLFFNAASQSAARFTRTMATPKAKLPGQNGQSDGWFKRAPATAKLAAGVVAFEVMKTMFNIAMSGEGEDGELYYNTIPDYVKERNSIIFYGDGPNDYLTLPIPYGYNMFNNIGMTIGELSTGQRGIIDAGVFLGMGALNSFSPLGFGQGDNVIERIGLGFLPTALRFPVDLYSNTSFTGNQIIREQYPFGAPVPEWTLSFRSPEVVKQLAKYLNGLGGKGTENVSGPLDFNPDPYAYLISAYTAGLGKTVGQVANLGRIGYEMAKRKVTRLQNLDSSDQFLDELFTMREEDTVPIERKDIPFLNILYGKENKYYNYDVFTENINELGQYTREIEKGETDAQGLNFVGVQQLNEVLKGTKKRLEIIREAKQNAQKIEDYIDRINAIHQLTEAELVEISQFNKAYYELRGKYIDPRSRNAITNAIHERQN